MNYNVRKWLEKWRSPNSQLRDRTIWEVSSAWERQNSNEDELWELEPDREGVRTAHSVFNEDREKYLRIVSELADRGSVWSMQRLGEWHESKWGVGPDLSTAEQWHIKAVKAGSWTATLGLARVYNKQRRLEECFEILGQGVSKGFVPSSFWLSWYRVQNSKSRRTFELIKSDLIFAADSGHPAAQLCLARWMINGKFGMRCIPEGVRRLNAFADRMIHYQS